MMQVYDQAKKKKLIEKISYLGIEKVPYLLIQTGKERIAAFSGSFSRQEISKISQLLSVEGVGLYFGKQTESGLRLSIDALHLLKEQIKKNIIEITEEQELDWFKGKQIELTSQQIEKFSILDCFVAVKSGEDIIGTGKLSQDKKFVANFLPKERRIKTYNLI